jgi:hypothetical protein
MIAKISTPVEVCVHNGFDFSPVKKSALFNCPLIQRLDQQRLQKTSQPLVSRNIESFFFTSEDWSRQLILHQLPQYEFQIAPADFHVFG